MLTHSKWELSYFATENYIQLYGVGTIILLCYKGVHAVNGRVMLYFALQTVYVYTHAKVGVLLVLGYYSLYIHTYWREIGDTFG